MMTFEQIKTWFPENLGKKQYARFVFREYFQFMILDHLAGSQFAGKISFIGGSSLRLIYGINRFSEDLDFDNRNLTRSEFILMTDSVIKYLRSQGYHVIADDKEKDKNLNAFRRNLVFPEFLYRNGLSPFKDERFLIKIESQDQKKKYEYSKTLIKGCGFVFYFNIPPLPVLCSMKLSALLQRKKGRDFFDAMFLLQKTEPDYNTLPEAYHIKDKTTLKKVLKETAGEVNLKNKSRDFEHLLFDPGMNKQVLYFGEFAESL
jgi:predicted nucleotidyltransferase component of viral defense system